MRGRINGRAAVDLEPAQVNRLLKRITSLLVIPLKLDELNQLSQQHLSQTGKHTDALGQ